MLMITNELVIMSLNKIPEYTFDLPVFKSPALFKIIQSVIQLSRLLFPLISQEYC